MSLLHILPNTDRQTANFGSFSRMGTLRHLQVVVLFRVCMNSLQVLG